MTYISHGKIFMFWYIISKQNIMQKRKIKENFFDWNLTLGSNWLVQRFKSAQQHIRLDTKNRDGLYFEEDVDKTYF